MAKGKNSKPSQVPAQNSEVASTKKNLLKMLANLDPHNALFETRVSQLINSHIPYIAKGQHQLTLAYVCDSLKSQGCKTTKLNVIQAKFYDELAHEFRRIAEEHSSTAKTLGATKPAQGPAASKIQNAPMQQPAKQVAGPGPSTLSGSMTQKQGVSWTPKNITPALPGTQFSMPFSVPYAEQQAAGLNYAQQLPPYHNQSYFGSHLAGFQGMGAGAQPVLNNWRGPAPQTSGGGLGGTSSNQESALATKKSKSAAVQSIRFIMNHSEMSLKGVAEMQESAMANAIPGNERAYFLNSLEVAVIRAYIHQHGRISDLLRVNLRPALASSLPNNVVRRTTAKILYDVENILQKWYSDGALQITTGASSNEV